jgi:hypothetical protein
VIRESTILFRNISDACLINDATRQSGNKKTFTAINRNVEVSCKNLWSLDDLNPGDLPAAMACRPSNSRGTNR